MRLHGLDQVIIVERLADMLDKSFAQGAFAALGPLGVGGQGDDGDGLSDGIGLESADHLPAIGAELAQVDVEQDQVGLFGSRQAQADVAVAGVEELVVVFFHPAADQLRDVGLILDIEDLRHGFRSGEC